MCGICGSVTTQFQADLQSVRSMNAAVVHRGPNGAGEYAGAHLARTRVIPILREKIVL
jgi:asparagine synthetase B (glutamine-hydrolysing)